MKLLIRLFISILLCAGLTGCATTSLDESSCQQRVSVRAVSPLSMEGLADVPGSNRQRAARALRMLAEVCEQVETEDVRRSFNVQCVIEGVSEKVIVIGAHHDKLGTGKGIADNWTGVMMLAALADQLRKEPLTYTYHLVAFAEEEDGLYGAKRYVRSARRDESLPIAMLNLDAVGMGRLHIDPRSDDALVCPAIATAKALDVDIALVSIDETTGDWEPFSRAGVPVLNLHSLTRKSLNYLHTYRDTRNLIDERKLAASYQVVVNLVMYLDTFSPEAFASEPGINPAR